jgi:type IV pilus assembly protein PilN
MRLNINLATRPYEDAREFWSRWGVGVAALGVVTLVLLTLAVHGWVKAGRDRHTILGLQKQIEDLDRERAQAQGFLELDINRSTREQSQFLNGLIQRKGFSWTRVFEDLERVMPQSLHVVALKPELNDQNQLELEMKVAADNRGGAVDLVHRMEGSKHFQNAQLVQEASSENGAGVTATINAIYVPDMSNRSGK